VVDVLKAADVHIVGMVSIFTYGFDHAVKAFQDAGVQTRSLTNYATMIDLAVEKGIVSQEDKALLMDWSLAPSVWGR
jgi:orotate phosphoribosyltransferase